MDILHLVDRLEELFNDSRTIPFTHNVVVDEDKMLDLIDQMRIAIPEEMRKAQQLIAQRDRLLAQAQEEANRTVSIAKEKSDRILEHDGIVESARDLADDIEHQAILESENTKREADNYVITSLSSLESELDRMLNQVKNGILVLRQKYASPENPTIEEIGETEEAQ